MDGERRGAETGALDAYDFLFVQFPEGQAGFDAWLVAELTRLSDEGLITVVQTALVQKACDDTVTVFPVAEPGSVQLLAGDRRVVVSDGALRELTEQMPAGSVAGVVVWENTWRAPIADWAEQTRTPAATGRALRGSRTGPRAATASAWHR